MEALRADDSTGLVGRVGQARRVGVLDGQSLYVAIGFGTQLIAAAPHSIVTVFDFTNCYAAPPVVLPCERVAYQSRRA